MECAYREQYLKFEKMLLQYIIDIKHPKNHDEREKILIDFILNSGSLIRLFYCVKLCPQSNICWVAKEILDKKNENYFIIDNFYHNIYLRLNS